MLSHSCAVVLRRLTERLLLHPGWHGHRGRVAMTECKNPECAKKPCPYCGVDLSETLRRPAEVHSKDDCIVNLVAREAKLAEALRTIPFREYGDAKYEGGCSSNAAWDCFTERASKHIDAALTNLSPAAQELLRKAQAHDEMEEENERLRRALKGELPMNVVGNCFYCDLGVPLRDGFIHTSSQFPDEPRCLMHPEYDDARAALAGEGEG